MGNKLSDKLREFRREAGISASKLAWMSDLSSTYIYDLEKGRKSPSLEVAWRLAKTLGGLLGRDVWEEFRPEEFRPARKEAQ